MTGILLNEKLRVKKNSLGSEVNMKALFVVLAAVMLCASLPALIVPNSATPVLTPQNMISSFVRVDPDDMKPETLPTKAWIWQDGNDLMVYFEAEIDAGFQTGRASMRDQGAGSDYLRVQLITQPESYYAYYYLAFPVGGLMDGTRNMNMSVDYSWNSSYSYESDYSGKLWRLTMRIPLSELRFPSQPPYQWKVILARYNKGKEEIYSAPYVNTNMGKDYFLKGIDLQLNHPIKRKLDIKLKPYLVRSYDLMYKTSSFDPDNLGLDVSLNPGQRTRVKLSFNPDYSDVPPDNASDNYNSKYPPYYNENRFFFSEDIDAFGWRTCSIPATSPSPTLPGRPPEPPGRSTGACWELWTERSKTIQATKSILTTIIR